jgi:DNA-binding NarL/FixJ family response regulator
MRILVIEDEIIIARFIEQILNKHFECDVQITLNPKEAEKAALAFMPNIILCDINLNGAIDGIELIQKLQKLLNFETIFITSYQSREIIDKAALTSPVTYIIKPFKENQFIATLKILITNLTNKNNSGTKSVNELGLFTKAEYNILKLIADNKSTSEIAKSLFISPSTVKNHRHNIVRKLQLPPDTHALVKWVVEHKADF